MNHLCYTSQANSAVFLPTDVFEITKIIESLKNSSSVGHDDVKTAIVKASCPVIAKPLTYSIKKSLNIWIFPDSLKFAKILPVFNPEIEFFFYQLSTNNPFALLFKKIYEKIMYSRLKNYISSINIPFSNQFGFRKNSSTYMAIANFVNDITN